jgi:hypothetical protein
MNEAFVAATQVLAVLSAVVAAPATNSFQASKGAEVRSWVHNAVHFSARNMRLNIDVPAAQ